MEKSIIDTSYNFYTDAKGGDPDNTSPTLKKYHKFLWNKQLPCGKTLQLLDNKKGVYLYTNQNLENSFSGAMPLRTHINCTRVSISLQNLFQMM